ncbi:phospholipase D-like protein [Rhizobium sp. PP-F2F-G20b]|nr:phospholipase D-like protein [Rhizobium sp. PP-F2F-G20b]
MLKFLDEKALISELRSVLKTASKATIVVPFWGANAVELLSLRKDWERLSIVCNLASGACNPAEVQRLIELQGAEVKTSASLHGKVYLTDSVVFLGSSNASTNGLVAEEASDGWAEANILTDDPSFMQSARSWCDLQIINAISVTPELLDQAQRLWNARRRLPVFLPASSLSVFDVARSNPEAVREISIVLWTAALSPVAKERLAELPSTKLDFYEGWGGSLPNGAWLIDVALDNLPRRTSFFQVVDAKKDSNLDLTLVVSRNHIRVDPWGELSLSPGDVAALQKAADHLYGLEEFRQTGGGVVVPLSYAIGIIDAASPY